VEAGPVKLLILALISNCIPYTTVPYLVIIAPQLAKMRGLELATAIVMLALGATLGKLVVYSAGRLVGHFKQLRARLRGLVKAVNTYKKATFLAVFIAAALPVPDDVVYIPVGVSGYNVFSFFIALFLGKIVVTTLAALYGVAVLYVFERTDLSEHVYVILAVVLTIIVVFIVNQINWDEFDKIYREQGIRKALVFIVISAAKAFLKIRCIRH